LGTHFAKLSFAALQSLRTGKQSFPTGIPKQRACEFFGIHRLAAVQQGRRALMVEV
jgi:hypothetical protein